MKRILTIAVGLCPLTASASQTFEAEVSAGRRWAQTWSENRDHSHQMNESTIGFNVSLASWLETPLSIGPFATYQVYKEKDFTESPYIRSDAINLEYGLQGKWQGNFNSPINPYLRVRQVIHSHGEKTFAIDQTATGYDAIGSEEFTTTGTHLALGAAWAFSQALSLQLEADYAAKMISHRKRNVKEYRINLDGGNDRLEAWEPSQENRRSYNSWGVAMGLGFSF